MNKPFPECEDCQYWTSQYGCVNYGECELYQDREEERKIDEGRDDR